MVLKIQTLNVNRSALLAGLLDILRDDQPDLVCLQEVTQGTQELSLLVRRFGYAAVASLREDTGAGGVAVVYKVALPVQEVQELAPGHLQLIKTDIINIINIYAPSGNNNRDQRRTFFGDILLRNLRLRNNLPILIGDFNCVIHRNDTMENYNLKKCDALRDIVTLFNYSDSLNVFYPHLLGQWTFSRPGMSPSRLDRVYLPPNLTPNLVGYTASPTLSDHRMVEVALDIQGPVRGPRNRSPYWKLNTRVLIEPNFLDQFRDFWESIIPLQAEYDNCADW